MAALLSFGLVFIFPSCKASVPLSSLTKPAPAIPAASSAITAKKKACKQLYVHKSANAVIMIALCTDTVFMAIAVLQFPRVALQEGALIAKHLGAIQVVFVSHMVMPTKTGGRVPVLIFKLLFPPNRKPRTQPIHF